MKVKRSISTPIVTGTPAFQGHAPVRGVAGFPCPWEGAGKVKPWDHSVTAVIPCLDTPDELELVVKLLLAQTVSPYIQIIDTGSTDDNLHRIFKLRSEQVEVHSLRFNGVKHPSDFPALAMDLAFAACQTEWIFATHADCFLRRRDVIEEFVTLATHAPIRALSLDEGDRCSLCAGMSIFTPATHIRGWGGTGGEFRVCREHEATPLPALGYRISPRSHANWEGMVSHTASLFHVPTMLRIGATWNQRRACLLRGIEDHRPDPARANWPDTEIMVNECLWRVGATALLVDAADPVEQNFVRNCDHRIDHCRTLTAGKLYSPEHYGKAVKWSEDAREQARQRLHEWEG